MAEGGEVYAVTAYSSFGRRKQPLGRNVQLGRSAPLAGGVPLQTFTGLQRYQPIRPASSQRRAENRERRAMADAMFGGERPLCFVPWCGQWADDLHEALTRARGGSITDPGTLSRCAAPTTTR